MRLSLLCLSLGLVLPALAARTTELRIDLQNTRPGPEYGADAKLTLKPWSESPQADQIARRLFADGDFSVFRIPIYAMRPIDDPIYDQIIAMSRLARQHNPDVILFASVANGDGDKSNWLHNEHKFPASMLKGEADIYGLKLDVYAAYLDSFLRRMREAGVAVDWLGAFNEDKATPRDYQRLWKLMKEDDDGRLLRVGVESWALRTAIQTVGKIAPHVDIVGAHFYDDTESKTPIPRDEWTSAWAKFVRSSDRPAWFTEATDYQGPRSDKIDDTLAGLERLIPSLNAGVRGVIFYQVVPRFINYDAKEAPKKFSAFQALIQGSRGKQWIATDHKAGHDVQTMAYLDAAQKSIILHIANSREREVTFELAPTRGSLSPEGTARIWDANKNGDAHALPDSDNGPVTVAVPRESYLVVSLPLTQTK